MYVLNAVLNDKLTALCRLVDVPQRRQQLRQFVLAYQPDAFKHGDVSHGAQHVVFGQIEVHLAVAAHGEALYLFVDLVILIPKFLHHQFEI